MLPKIQPLRPIRSRVVPVGREWLYEPKLDGFRGVLMVDGEAAWFTSKNGHKMRRFDDLAAELRRSLDVRDAILDGEILVIRNGWPDFNALFFRRGRPSYAAFDLLWLNGRDLRALPLWRRKRRLRALVSGSSVGLVESVNEPALFSVAVEHDLEGIVAKRRSDPYAAETEWIKVKHSGYTQMQGRWELFDKKRNG
jgi:bifunctional non-homologous end joining protein LigD